MRLEVVADHPPREAPDEVLGVGIADVFVEVLALEFDTGDAGVVPLQTFNVEVFPFDAEGDGLELLKMGEGLFARLDLAQDLLKVNTDRGAQGFVVVDLGMRKIRT